MCIPYVSRFDLNAVELLDYSWHPIYPTARAYTQSQDAHHLVYCIVPLETIPELTSEEHPSVGRPASAGSSISAMQSRKRQGYGDARERQIELRSESVLRRVRLGVCPRAQYTARVGRYESHGDSRRPLRARRSVVRHPADQTRTCGIYSRDHEAQSGVMRGGRTAPEEHGKARYRQE
jgi:hypothetical protein